MKDEFKPKPKARLTKMVQVRLTEEECKLLLTMANKNNVSKYELLRQMVRHCLGGYDQ